MSNLMVRTKRLDTLKPALDYVNVNREPVLIDSSWCTLVEFLSSMNNKPQAGPDKENHQVRVLS